MHSSKSHYKIVLLGEGRVGKSSLVQKYINNEFDPKQESTSNASYLEKTVKIGGE